MVMVVVMVTGLPWSYWLGTEGVGGGGDVTLRMIGRE